MSPESNSSRLFLTLAALPILALPLVIDLNSDYWIGLVQPSEIDSGDVFSEPTMQNILTKTQGWRHYLLTFVSIKISPLNYGSLISLRTWINWISAGMGPVFVLKAIWASAFFIAILQLASLVFTRGKPPTTEGEDLLGAMASMWFCVLILTVAAPWLILYAYGWVFPYEPEAGHFIYNSLWFIAFILMSIVIWLLGWFMTLVRWTLLPLLTFLMSPFLLLHGFIEYLSVVLF